jgi:hypothetical protein
MRDFNNVGPTLAKPVPSPYHFNVDADINLKLSYDFAVELGQFILRNDPKSDKQITDHRLSSALLSFGHQLDNLGNNDDYEQANITHELEDEQEFAEERSEIEKDI